MSAGSKNLSNVKIKAHKSQTTAQSILMGFYLITKKYFNVDRIEIILRLNLTGLLNFFVEKKNRLTFLFQAEHFYLYFFLKHVWRGSLVYEQILAKLVTFISLRCTVKY